MFLRHFVFTDEFTAVGSNPVSSQLCRVCRRDIIMVSAVICFGGKGRLHFIPAEAKIYVETL